MKTRNDWPYSIGEDGKALISEYVEMAECVANNNIGWDKKPLYCLDKLNAYFDCWKLELVKQRLKEKSK